MTREISQIAKARKRMTYFAAARITGSSLDEALARAPT
jgi:hypothetical protein